MSTSRTLLVQRDGGVLKLTLNRPEKRNALNADLIAAIRAAVDAAVEDADCRVILLAASGAAFCSGMDLAYLESLTDKTEIENRTDGENIAGLLRTIYDARQPTIAAVNGAAVAGGMGLAMVCDFTLAAPEAKFGFPEVRIGFVPAIVSAFLRQQSGDKRARDLLLSGRLIEAREAEAMGLVTRVVARDHLMMEAQALAARLKGNSPQAIAATKRLLREQSRRTLDAQIEAAIRANVEARATGDFREGLRAFLEKRKPKWTES